LAPILISSQHITIIGADFTESVQVLVFYVPLLSYLVFNIVTLKSGLEVIENSTIQNPGSSCIISETNARYWSKIAFIHTTPACNAHVRGYLLKYCHNISTENLELCGYPTVKKLGGYVQLYRHNTGV